MHLYRNKRDRVARDRPQGVNIPGGARRLIKCTSGDTLSFTALVRVPSTQEPVRLEDLETTVVHIAVAENRFTSVLWSGSTHDGWIRLDEYKHGLVHITVPRTLMNVLRRGSYAFSVVVDDGIVRETQLTGNFQIEYEPTGSINDIPYRYDKAKGSPISLTPEVDLAAQEHHRLTYDQLVDAVDAVSRVLIGTDELSQALSGDGECDYEPTDAEVERAVHKLAQLILWDNKLRAKLPAFVDGSYDPTNSELVDRVCRMVRERGIRWSQPPSVAHSRREARE